MSRLSGMGLAAPPLRWMGALLLTACIICLPAPAFSHTGFVQASNGVPYYPFTIQENQLRGPPDQSALNHPLGPADRIFSKAGHFYTVGPDLQPHTDDDQRIRLFGANLSFAANFPAEPEARDYARRLRKLGFNAVRLHHLDTHPSNDIDPPRSVLTEDRFPTFNPVAIQRLRHFVDVLIEEGLYINLNLRVGYRFRPETDGLPSLDHQDRPASVGTPIHVYYPPLIERQALYAETLIHALGLEHNPGLAMVEINNESSLLAAWIGDAWYGDAWSNAIPSHYAPVLENRWKQWAIQKYGSASAACDTWRNCQAQAGPTLPITSMAGYDSAGPNLAQRIQARLGALVDSLHPSRHPAPGAPLAPEEQYRQDFLAFLTQMDQEYLDHMKAVILQATGEPVLVTGTQMTYGGLLNFDSHRHMDYLDNHVYLGHPVYANGNPWLSDDWRISRTYASGSGLDTLLALSLRRDRSKPFVISEFNQPFPNPRGGEIMPLMAFVASLQDWDGLFFFGYDDSLETKQAPWYFSLSGDWGKYVLTGQSARLFRQFLIPSAAQRLALPLGPSERRWLTAQGHIRTGTLEKSVRTQYGLTPDAALSAQISQDILDTDSSDDAIPPAALEGVTQNAHTGFLRAASQQQIIFHMEHAWGFFGRLEQDSPIRHSSFGLHLYRPQQQNIQMLITALDDQPMERSQHMLLTLGSHTTGTQPGSMPARPKALVPYPGKTGWLTLEPDPGQAEPSGLLAAAPPAWMQQDDIELLVPYPSGTFSLYPLDGTGRRLPKLPPEAYASDPTTGQTRVRLQAVVQTASPWYEIVRHPSHGTHSESH